MSQFLREGEIQVLHGVQCPAATNLHHLFNFESMICAFSAEHVDTCAGDSGGVKKKLEFLALLNSIFDIFSSPF